MLTEGTELPAPTTDTASSNTDYAHRTQHATMLTLQLSMARNTTTLARRKDRMSQKKHTTTNYKMRGDYDVDMTEIKPTIQLYYPIRKQGRMTILSISSCTRMLLIIVLNLKAKHSKQSNREQY